MRTPLIRVTGMNSWSCNVIEIISSVVTLWMVTMKKTVLTPMMSLGVPHHARLWPETGSGQLTRNTQRRWGKGSKSKIKFPTFLQLGPDHVCVILSHRRDSITSVWYFVIQCITSPRYYHRNMILHKFQLFQIWKKNKIFLLLQNYFEMEIWNIFSLCCRDLKRAPLPDTFFCVKNMTKMKYHADVIHSITQTW